MTILELLFTTKKIGEIISGLPNYLIMLIFIVIMNVMLLVESSTSLGLQSSRWESESSAFKTLYRVPDQAAYVGQLFTYKFPAKAFQSEKIKSIEVFVAPKSPLPTWLMFSRSSKELKGIPTLENLGELSIRVIVKYYDLDEFTSHVFKILVLTNNKSFDRRFTADDIIKYNLDKTCENSYPKVLVLFFNMNYEFLNLESKIDVVSTISAKTEITLNEIFIGKQSDAMITSSDCNDKLHHSVDPKKSGDQLAIRFLIKNCLDYCTPAKDLYVLIDSLKLNHLQIVYWAVYDIGLKEPPSDEKPKNFNPKLPWENDKGLTDNDKSSQLANPSGSGIDKANEIVQPQINWDFMVNDEISIYVGEIKTIPISPYLVMNENVYLLSSAEDNTMRGYLSTLNQWVQVVNDVTNDDDSKIYIIGLENMVGYHALCLKPSLIPKECLKFHVRVLQRPRNMEINHAISLEFQFPLTSFDRSMEVKMNLISNILKTVYPTSEVQKFESFQLNDYTSSYDTLTLNISLNNYYASLCAVKQEIIELYSTIVVTDPQGESTLTKRYLLNTADFTPLNASLELFGPCSAGKNADSSFQQETANDTITFSISTILLVSILIFIILVVLGVVMVLVIMHMSTKKSEPIYCGDSFCEMRAKNVVPIFGHEVNENNSSRSSSPSRLYSLVHQSSTKSSFTQVPVTSAAYPQKIIFTSKVPDTLHSRNSCASGQSNACNRSINRTSPFENITQIIRPTPPVSPPYIPQHQPASSPLRYVEPPQVTLAPAPDILKTTATQQPQMGYYDIAGFDPVPQPAVSTMGSYRHPKVETSYASKMSPQSPQSPRLTAEFCGDESKVKLIEGAPNKNEGKNNESDDDESEFLQFRMPSPLPTQALLLQAQANIDKQGHPRNPSHRFC